LKNSPSVSFFKNAWNLVKLYWESKDVKKEFIEAFKKEYIDKVPQWHYGAAFCGKSRTNNSLESGNNVLKNFFNRVKK